MKRFRDSEVWKWIRTILELAALTAAVLALIHGCNALGLAEDDCECWVMCRPESEVLIRKKPDKRAEVTGYAVCGDRFRTDWTEKDGFIHVTDVGNEYGEGWISARYLFGMEPVRIDGPATVRSNGRVAVRKYPGGKRSGWVTDGTVITVYCIAEEWAVTSKGYIQTRYLEVGE